MPAGKTKFQASWLESVDSNGCKIGFWCRKGKNEFSAYCSLCMSEFSVSNNGKYQVMSHAAKKKHVNAYKSSKSTQSILNVQGRCTKADAGSSRGDMLKTTLSCNQQITQAEILWCLKAVNSNYSYYSCNDLKDMFSVMFSDSAVAQGFQLSERKTSYMISYGLAPYFSSCLAADMQRNIHSTYTLSFDETTTVQVKKQFDVHIRFWSSKNMVECAYLTSAFLGHASADVVKNTLLEILKEYQLPLNKLTMLSMDGPNVNKLVHKKVNDELDALGEPKLIDIGTCSLHIVHNAMAHGLEKLQIDIDEFATDLFSFFKASAARREEIKGIQSLLDVENHFFLRHVSSRWLTIEPVLMRIIEQYNVLSEYFLKPKDNVCRQVLSTARFKRIQQNLQDPCTLAYMQFIVSLSPIFSEFLSLFQGEGPLIHILYSKSNELLVNVMKKFLKSEALQGKEGKLLQKVDVSDGDKLLPLRQIEIGAGARKTLAPLEHAKSKLAYLNFRQCLMAVAKYLQTKLPITCEVLKDLQALHPLLKENSLSVNAVRRLCCSMKTLKLSDGDVDRIVQEWICYQGEDICKEWYVKSENYESGVRNVSYERIDVYWSKVFQIVDTDSGKPKYMNLSRLIKAYLLLFHGNADVERGFSFNNSILRKDRVNLSEKSVVAIRKVKDAIRRNGGSISKLPVTVAMMKQVKAARSAYLADLELERKEEERKHHQKALKEKEDMEQRAVMKRQHDIENELIEMKKKRQKLQSEVKIGQQLLDEGAERLNRALLKKDIRDATFASSIIDAGKDKLSENMNVLSETDEIVKSLENKLVMLKKK